MSSKCTSSSFCTDIEVTTKSRTPFNSRTPRLNTSKCYSRSKRNSLTPKYNSHFFRAKTVLEKMQKSKAIVEPSNTITKEMIKAISKNIIKLKNEKVKGHIKQQELCNELQKSLKIKKELGTEEAVLIRKLDDIGKQRTEIKQRLQKNNIEILETKHQMHSKMIELNKCNNKLQTKIKELYEEKTNYEISLNTQRQMQKNERNEMNEYKKTFEAESLILKTMLKELYERSHLAIIKECKTINEYKNRISEIDDILNTI